LLDFIVEGEISKPVAGRIIGTGGDDIMTGFVDVNTKIQAQRAVLHHLAHGAGEHGRWGGGVVDVEAGRAFFVADAGANGDPDTAQLLRESLPCRLETRGKGTDDGTAAVAIAGEGECHGTVPAGIGATGRLGSARRNDLAR